MILKVKQPGGTFSFYSGIADLTFFSSRDLYPRYFYCSDGGVYHQILEESGEVKWLPMEPPEAGSVHWDLGSPPCEHEDETGKPGPAYVPICGAEAFRAGGYERWYFWEAFLMSEEGRTIERLF